MARICQTFWKTRIDLFLRPLISRNFKGPSLISRTAFFSSEFLITTHQVSDSQCVILSLLLSSLVFDLADVDSTKFHLFGLFLLRESNKLNFFYLCLVRTLARRPVPFCWRTQNTRMTQILGDFFAKVRQILRFEISICFEKREITAKLVTLDVSSILLSSKILKVQKSEFFKKNVRQVSFWLLRPSRKTWYKPAWVKGL